MSEFRQDPVTHEWVIVAPERAKRPRPLTQIGPEVCPFCPGAEGTGTIASIDNAEGEWLVRVIENRYPILAHDVMATAPRRNETWRHLPGCGRHEIVIDAREHTATLGTVAPAQVRRMLGIYVERVRALSQVPGVREIVVFRNHGERAGASLRHPHSQIVATPLISPVTRRRIMDEIAYFDDYGECALCRVLADEREAEVRLIHQSARFVSYSPFASRVSHHARVVPQRHCPRFEDVQTEELDDLAQHLHDVFAALEADLDDPDQNLVIASPPLDLVHQAANHWFIDILPRLAIPAGFEIGSGIVVTTSAPEAAAARLRARMGPVSELV